MEKNKSAIIIIDDDDDDLELLQEVFKELDIENEIIIFNDGLKFLEFAKSTSKATFFILCDINMSLVGGLELKKRIYEDEELRLKCVPFIFLSTSRGSSAIMNAYSFGVQGFFIKPSTFSEAKEMVLSIINY